MSADPRWIIPGEHLRRAYWAMRRMDRDDFPVRIDWPPRVGSGTAPPGPSGAIKGVLQLHDITRAIEELKYEDYEAWLAVDLIDVKGKPMARAENLVRSAVGFAL